jgi:cell division protein FtsL
LSVSGKKFLRRYNRKVKWKHMKKGKISAIICFVLGIILIVFGILQFSILQFGILPSIPVVVSPFHYSLIIVFIGICLIAIGWKARKESVREDITLKKLEIFFFICNIVVSSLILIHFNLDALGQNREIHDLNVEIEELEEAKLNLSKRILELNKEIHNLTETIFKYEHPTPIIRIFPINHLKIGPTSSLRKYNDLASFNFSGSMNLEIEAFVFSKHEGQFFVSNDTLYFNYTKKKAIELKFMGYVGRLSNFSLSKNPMNNITTFDFPFDMCYWFSESSILQHLDMFIGILSFKLEFHEFATSYKCEKDFSVEVWWNNQTLMG